MIVDAAHGKRSNLSTRAITVLCSGEREREIRSAERRTYVFFRVFGLLMMSAARGCSFCALRLPREL